MKKIEQIIAELNRRIKYYSLKDNAIEEAYLDLLHWIERTEISTEKVLKCPQCRRFLLPNESSYRCIACKETVCYSCIGNHKKCLKCRQTEVK